MIQNTDLLKINKFYLKHLTCEYLLKDKKNDLLILHSMIFVVWLILQQ